MQVSSANSANAVSRSSDTSTNPVSDLAILRQPIPDDCSIGNKMDLKQQKRNIIDKLIKERRLDAELDLSKAELNQLDLKEVNLRSANLKRANLQNANLDRACLSGANLAVVKLQEATLKYARLANANLDYAYLTNAKLNMATLNHAKLYRTNLINADLSYANMNQTQLYAVDLHRAILKNTKLMSANLREVNFVMATMCQANLSDSDLQFSTFTDADLTDANLSETDLSYTNFTNAKLNGANLSHANLIGAKLNGADLVGAKLCNIALPVWDENQLDIYLNHINNASSLLTTIDSIDNKYNNKKIALIHELIDSLDKRSAHVSLSSVVAPLLDTLAKAPYNQDQKIINWLSHNILPLYLAKYDACIMKALTDSLLVTLLNCFTNQSQMMFSHNGAFIQLISQAMAGEGSHKEQAETLYNCYLQDDRVAPYTKGDFGNYAGKPVWPNKDADNFILLSAKPDSHYAMMMSQNQLQRMLDIQLAQPENINWHGFYLYQGQDNIGPADYRLDDLFEHHFKLFASNYLFQQQQAKFGKLLTTLALGELQTTFKNAITQSFSTIKLIDFDSQAKLAAIFDNKFKQYIENGVIGYRLTDQYKQQLLAVYQLTAADTNTQAGTLLSLAAVFSKYSSSAIFGTETESPNTLRYFAFALMEQAHQLLPQTFEDEAQYKDWSDRLLGNNNAFSCTAVLSTIMVEHIKAHFPVILAGIMPPAWS